MRTDFWGYGLGLMSQTEWYDLHAEAEQIARSSRVAWTDAIDSVVAREQLKKLGMHGMAAEWSSMRFSTNRADCFWRGSVYRLLQAEFRERAWRDLRKGWGEREMFPAPSLDQPDFIWNTLDVMRDASDLARSGFIEFGKNAAFVGGPSTCKTYFAIAIALDAMVDDGNRVKLFDATDLVMELETGRCRLDRLIKKMRDSDLVIIDGFGDEPFGEVGGEQLIRLLQGLEGRTSVVLTTRLDPSHWAKPFGSTAASTEFMGRFAGKCSVVSTGSMLCEELVPDEAQRS
ncbi:MAG: ATP-binding protein [Pseudomonadota bacterium]